jgi:tetratricopeptide (TPR) repeat protein/DNA-binding winged helix-turn-helix (wHTH) protein
MNQQGHHIYRLDGFEVDASQVCLKRDGEERHLRQKTFQVLLYLLEHRERLVTKDELIESIWADTAVTDNALEQCLAEIRKVLGDDSRNPRFIKTVPRAGYRFIGGVEVVDTDKPVPPEFDQISQAPPAAEIANPVRAPQRFSRAAVLVLGIMVFAGGAIGTGAYLRNRSKSASSASMTVSQDPAKRSVAVMFFDNQSGNAELDWLREGLTDMIITDLSRSRNIAVLSRQQLAVLLSRTGRNESDRIQLDEALDIARASHAKVLLLGSFAKLGEQIRIDVHLHDGRSGELLTAERLVVDQPSQILTQVDLLSLKLATYLGGNGDAGDKAGLSSVMTNNLEAYRYYSLGVEKAQGLRNEEAIALLQKATELDPNFAMAFARIGYVHAVRGTNPALGRPYLEKGYQLSERLVEKDKLYISGWYALANFDYPSAINSFRQIIANYPLDVEAYSHLSRLLRGEDRTEESLEVAKQGLVIDENSTELYNILGSAYSDLGRHDEAIAMFRRYVELAPGEPNAHDSLALGLQWAGRYSEASDEFQKALSIKPDFEIAVIHLGNTYFQLGRYREALKQFDQFIRMASSDLDTGRGWYSTGWISMKLGKSAQAEQAGKLNLKNRKGGAENLFMLAVQRGDLTSAKTFLETIEARAIADRGTRSYSRDVLFYRGWFELKSGHSDQALETFKEVLKRRPMTFHFESWEDCLANAYLELGRFDESIAEYERILKLNPNYPLVHYGLAQSYEGKGLPAQARKEYEQFLQIWKDADANVPEVIAAKKALGG